MAFIQKTIPSPNKVYTFSLKNFAGGLNNSSDQLIDNESSDLINMSFCDDTLMEKRLGQTYYDELILYDNEVTPTVDGVLFIDEYKPYTGTDTLIRSTDLKVYLGTTKIADVTGEIDGENFQGKYFFADGDELYCYGIFAQTTSTYEKVTGTAVATAVVMKVVTPDSGYTPLDNTHVKGVTHYNYTAMTVSYEPCANEIADTYLGANVVPDDVKYIVSHGGRLFLSGAKNDDDNVFISDIQNPYYYPVTLPMQLPPNSDKIAGMSIYDDSVIIGRHDDLYVIKGNTNNSSYGEVFMLKRLNSHTGFANNKAIDVVNNYLFFLGSDGVCYALTSTSYTEKNLVTTIISKQLDMFKSPINLTYDDVKTACSIYFDEEWYLSIKDKVLIYSYKNKAWTMYNNFNARSFYNLNNVLIWGNKDGRTVKFSDDYLDFDLPYQAYWYSKRFDMNNANNYKQFREFFLIAHVYNDIKSTINITFEIDYANVTGDVTIENKISIWGVSIWGDRFINRNIVESLPIVLGRRGRNLRFMFSNGYEIAGEVDDVSDLVDVLGKREGLLIHVVTDDVLYLYTEGDWKLMGEGDLNQRMKIYQVNGDYELRGKR